VNLVTIRRGFGVAGIALLGVALAIAPIAAFQGHMTLVSGLGIAGIAALIVMRLLPRPPTQDAEPPREDTGPR
jgi:hypothetical protein